MSEAITMPIQIGRLRPSKGHIGFVTQNNFATSKSAQPIRAWLQHNGHMRRYIDFSHTKLFDGQSAYACLLFAGRTYEPEFDFVRVNEDSTVNGPLTTIALSRLHPSKWRLADRRQLDHLERLERAGPSLGAFAEIKVGFATLADRVFMLSEVEGSRYRAADGTLFSQGDLDGLIRPAVRIPELTKPNSRLVSAIICPYRFEGERVVLVPEEELRERWPIVYNYLSQHRDVLDRRDKAKMAESWYAWGRRQGLKSVGPKWLTPTFAQRPNFSLIADNRLFCNGYSVRPRGIWGSAPAASDAVFHRLLNSSAMEYFARLTSFQIAGDYQCYQKNFIERFSIPDFSEFDAERIAKSETKEEADALILSAYGIDHIEWP